MARFPLEQTFFVNSSYDRSVFEVVCFKFESIPAFIIQDSLIKKYIQKGFSLFSMMKRQNEETLFIFVKPVFTSSNSEIIDVELERIKDLIKDLCD